MPNTDIIIKADQQIPLPVWPTGVTTSWLLTVWTSLKVHVVLERTCTCTYDTRKQIHPDRVGHIVAFIQMRQTPVACKAFMRAFLCFYTGISCQSGLWFLFLLKFWGTLRPRLFQINSVHDTQHLYPLVFFRQSAAESKAPHYWLLSIYPKA